MRALSAVVLVGALVVACAPPKSPEARRADILAHDAGAARAAVHERCASLGLTLDLTRERPANGWRERRDVASLRAIASEARTGRSIASVERFSGPDPGGSSLWSLAHFWYFYDASDVVVDAEWEYMSD